MIQEDVYKGRDNTIWVGLRMAKELIPLADITNIELLVGTILLSAEAFGGSGPDKPFDWTSYGDQGILILRLGHMDVPANTYLCKLIVYTEKSPSGVIWDYLRLRFKTVV